MEKQGKKSKKRRNSSSGEKEKSFFPHDLKSIKDNIKKEFLRTVKINNSFRVKEPRSTKVILNSMDDRESGYDTLEATNSIISNPSESNVSITDDSDLSNNKTETNSEVKDSPDINICDADKVSASNEHNDNKQCALHKSELDELEPSHDVLHDIDEGVRNLAIKCNFEESGSQAYDANISQEHGEKDHATALPTIGLSLNADRNRKYSLDNNILIRRPSWSQSEIDLHSVGKLPLERKSSFFRKKLDKFFKNTSEIFKKQSSDAKSENIKRRGSISFSLQSLNNPAIYENDVQQQSHTQGHVEGLNSGKTYSELSLAESQGSRPSQDTSRVSLVSSRTSLVDTHLSQPTLSTRPLIEDASGSTNSLKDGYQEDPLLNSRAISFSSGLDNVEDTKRRKAKRANRVTWLASDSVAEYMRRIVEDKREVDIPRSYSDTGSLPKWNSLSLSRSDSKGRRLSYQRAVSGEDPVRYQDRRKIKGSDQNEFHELRRVLTNFSQDGLPPLAGYKIPEVKPGSINYIEAISSDPRYLDNIYVGIPVTGMEYQHQGAIKEFICSEADYIKAMQTVLEVFVATAHKLQSLGLMLDVETTKLFLNIPDILNASIRFWDVAITPIIDKVINQQTIFSAENMYLGFYSFRQLFIPYTEYLYKNSESINYLKTLNSNKEFTYYINWCHSQKECKRLQLSDLLVKPMQKITKYTLLFERIITSASNRQEILTLRSLEKLAKLALSDINRAVRQQQEYHKMDLIVESLDAYLLDFKDEDMNISFQQFSRINLNAPILGCIPSLRRNAIHEANLRYKDYFREVNDVRVIIFTDIILICKKTTKSLRDYRVIRQKYIINNLHQLPITKYTSKSGKEYDRIVFLVVDELDSAYQCFSLWDPHQKEEPCQSMLLFQQKFNEARMTLDISTWFDLIPVHDPKDIEAFFQEYFSLKFSQDLRTTAEERTTERAMERAIRERVLAMLYDPNNSAHNATFTDMFDVTECQETRVYKIKTIMKTRGLSKSIFSRSQWFSLRQSSTQSQEASTTPAEEINKQRIALLDHQLQLQIYQGNNLIDQLKYLRKENVILRAGFCKYCSRGIGDKYPKSDHLSQLLGQIPHPQMPEADQLALMCQCRRQIPLSAPELPQPHTLHQLTAAPAPESTNVLQHSSPLQLPERVPSISLPATPLMSGSPALSPIQPLSPKSPLLLTPNFPISPRSPSSPKSPCSPKSPKILRKSPGGTSETEDEYEVSVDEEDEICATLRGFTMTVHVPSESESDTLVSKQSVSPRSPSLAPSNNGNHLQIHSPNTMMHQEQKNLEEVAACLSEHVFVPPVSESAYLSASEVLYRNHEIAIKQFKNRSGSPRRPSPDARRNSSPSRGKRSLAFSTSFKHPLMKMANVNSYTQIAEALSISRQTSPRSEHAFSSGSSLSPSKTTLLHDSDLAVTISSLSPGAEFSLSEKSSGLTSHKKSKIEEVIAESNDTIDENDIKKSKYLFKPKDKQRNVIVGSKNEDTTSSKSHLRKISDEKSDEYITSAMMVTRGVSFTSGGTSHDLSESLLSRDTDDNTEMSYDKPEKEIKRSLKVINAPKKLINQPLEGDEKVQETSKGSQKTENKPKEKDDIPQTKSDQLQESINQQQEIINPIQEITVQKQEQTNKNKSKDNTSLIASEKPEEKRSSKCRDSEDKGNKKGIGGKSKGSTVGCLFGFLCRQNDEYINEEENENTYQKVVVKNIDIDNNQNKGETSHSEREQMIHEADNKSHKKGKDQTKNIEDHKVEEGISKDTQEGKNNTKESQKDCTEESKIEDDDGLIINKEKKNKQPQMLCDEFNKSNDKISIEQVTGKDDSCVQETSKQPELDYDKGDNKDSKIDGEDDERNSSASSERRKIHKARDSIHLKKRKKRQEVFV